MNAKFSLPIYSATNYNLILYASGVIVIAVYVMYGFRDSLRKLKAPIHVNIFFEVHYRLDYVCIYSLLKYSIEVS